MTEAEWLGSTDPGAMVEFLGKKTDPRKLRLFACGCCRQIWDILGEDPSRKAAQRNRDAVEVAERHADGLATREELAAAQNAIQLAARAVMREAAWSAADELAWKAAKQTAKHAAWAFTKESTRGGAWYDPKIEERSRALAAIMAEQADLVRDLFGNPFRPVSFAPSWRTETAVGMAAVMYDSRDFADIPVLADALEDAGCDHPVVLAHCRRPAHVRDGGEINETGSHARGCWVIDALLRKP